MNIIILFSLSLATLAAAHESYPQTMKRLRADLFVDYDSMTRPVLSDATTTNITVKFGLWQLLDVDDRRELITIKYIIGFGWMDELLNWAPEEYGNITVIRVPGASLWTPEIQDLSGIDETLFNMETPSIRLYNTGFVHWETEVTGISSCPLDITDFPWDRQSCYVNITTWGYPLPFLNLTPTADIKAREMTPNGAWEVDDVTGGYTMDGGIWPIVNCKISMRRKPMFYIVNLVTPSMVIALLGLLAFWVPPDSGEKVSLSITVLLATTVFQLVVNESMPVQSVTVPSITKYFLLIFVLLGMSTASTVLVLFLHHHGNKPDSSSFSPRVSRAFLLLGWLLCVSPGPAMGQAPPSPHVEEIDHMTREVRMRKLGGASHVITWVFVAAVLDRIFFIIYSISILMLVIFLLFQSFQHV